MLLSLSIFQSLLNSMLRLTVAKTRNLQQTGNHRRQTGKLQQTQTNTSKCRQTLLILSFQGASPPGPPFYYIPPSFHKPICWNLLVFAMFASFFPVFTGVFRCLPVFAGVFLSLPVSAGVCQCLPVFAGVCRCLPVIA